MGALPSIVVAGYGAWAAAEVNPASQILKGLRRRNWPRCQLVVIEIPVVSSELYGRIEKELLDLKPAAWIGLGINTAAVAAMIRAELVAINWRHFSVPDNAGYCADMETVLDQGPPAYNADLPNREIVAAMADAGIPATHSFSCGTHLCNQMLYTSRHLVETHGLSTVCGFLHIPRTPEFVAKRSGPDELTVAMGLEIPSMGLDMMTEAVAIAVDRVAEHVALENNGA